MSATHTIAARRERVARAIYRRDPGYEDVGWDDLPLDSFARAVCLDQADAAIEEMCVADLFDALQGLSGLCQLILARRNLPQDVREVLTSNHRVLTARAAIAKANGRALIEAADVVEGRTE